MNVILLSGGSGKRLWPLSNDVRSKQFLQVFRKADGTKESMAQRMVRMIQEANPEARITIATGENQVPQIRAQLGETIGICAEPVRRDTFPAIALAAACLAGGGLSAEEPIVVCPIDPYVERDYFECLKRLSDEAGKTDAANLTLMGIEPTCPSGEYGYIIPASAESMALVRAFKEKPDRETAEKYIRQGALWNGGVFAAKLSYLLSQARAILGTDEYGKLYEKYAELEKISFDYAVAEKEPSINVFRFQGAWKDIGNWNTLTEAMEEDVAGKALADGCENTYVVNELGIPLVALGMKDCVIAATPDGILVADKGRTPELKGFVAEQRPMYESRSWGEYKVLDCSRHAEDNNSLVKEIVVIPGRHISYQYHRHRTEVWTFTEGTGELIINGVTREVHPGDVAVIKPGMKHAIRAITELHFIEVQLGDELTEDDIERLNWNWEE